MSHTWDHWTVLSGDQSQTQSLITDLQMSSRVTNCIIHTSLYTHHPCFGVGFPRSCVNLWCNRFLGCNVTWLLNNTSLIHTIAWKQQFWWRNSIFSVHKCSFHGTERERRVFRDSPPLERLLPKIFSFWTSCCPSSSLSSVLVLLTSSTMSFLGSTRTKLRHSNVRWPAEEVKKKQKQKRIHSQLSVGFYDTLPGHKLWKYSR